MLTKNGLIMTALWKTKPAGERVRCSMQILTPNQWTEAGNPCGWIREKLEEAEEEVYPVGGPTISNNLDLPGCLRHWASNQASYTRWYKATNTYTEKDCQVWTQSDEVHLILKGLQAPGSREVWWRGDRMVGTYSWRWGLWAWGPGSMGAYRQEIWGVEH